MMVSVIDFDFVGLKGGAIMIFVIVQPGCCVNNKGVSYNHIKPALLSKWLLLPLPSTTHISQVIT